MKTYSLKDQTIYVIIGKLFSLIFQLATPIILVRVFTKADYGLYQQIVTLALLLTPFLNFSFNNSIYYFYSRKKNADNSSYISQAILIPLVLNGIFVIFLLFFNNIVGEYLNIQENNKLIIFSILLIFLSANSIFLDTIFIVEGKAKHSLIYFSSDKIIRLVFVLIFVLLYKSVLAAVIALSLYFLIKFIFLIVYLSRHYKLSFYRIKRKTLKKQIVYIFPLYISTVFGKVGAMADKILLMTFLGASDFALYSIGSFKVPFITVLYSSIGNVIMPQLSEYSKRNDTISAHSLWKKMVIKNAMITIPVVIFFVVIAPEFITFLFTDDYSQSIIIFQITISIFLVQMLGHGYILRAFAKTKNILYANIIRTIASLIVGYFLVKYLGIIGAAILYVISFNINAIIQLVKSKKVLNVNWNEFLPWKDFSIFLLFSIISVISVLFLETLSIKPVWFLLFSSMSFFGLMLLLLIKFKYVFIEDIKSWIKMFMMK